MKTYAAKKVAISFKGIPIIGVAKGSFVEADLTSDTFTGETGSDGEGARVQSADESGTVKITLMQQSLSNDYLSDCHALDRRTALGTGSLFIKDASGTTLINLPEAWVKKPATVTFADGSTGREWTFETCKMDMKVGGN